MKKLLFLLFILLSFNVFSQTKKYSNESNKKTGVVLIVGGVAFTTAAILEGPYNYGTYVTSSSTTPNSSMKVNYVTQPFWKQTPRNIMLVVGVSLTITGLFSLKN